MAAALTLLPSSPPTFELALALPRQQPSDAHEAWSVFEPRNVKPNGATAYDDYPNFAIEPYSTPY